MIWLLKVLVGSRAHGLHTETSDYDYRGVFAWPTSAIVGMGLKQRETFWVEGDKDENGKLDDTAWELGHFCHLATQCNPIILEVFAAPRVEFDRDGYGESLRALFPYVWEPKRVRDAFIGYGINQLKKLLDDKDGRPNKYAVAYLRVLYQGYHLLTHGVLPVDLREHPLVYTVLKRWRAGEFTKGEVVDECLNWRILVEEAAAECKQVPDHSKVSEFLVHFRKEHW